MSLNKVRSYCNLSFASAHHVPSDTDHISPSTSIFFVPSDMNLDLEDLGLDLEDLGLD